MESFDEIRHRVAQGKARPRVGPAPVLMTEAQEEELIARGNQIDQLLNSEGWKLVNNWILERLNIKNVLYCKPEELIIYQQNVKAFTDLFDYMNGSVKLRDSIINERSKKDE